MEQQPALRILSLSQGATEALCALGLQNSLVGRSHECTGPPSVLALPCVSCNAVQRKNLSNHGSDDKSVQKSLARYDVNWELLKELKPDFIFIQDKPIVAGEHLDFPQQADREWFWEKDKKCRVVSLESHTIEGIFRNLQTIADTCCAEKKGERLVSELWARWKAVKQTTPQWADGMPRVSVACLCSINPLTGAGYWVPEIISCAGGLSLFGRAGCPGNSLTLRDLLERDPDVIVFSCHGLKIERLSREISWLEDSKEWRQVRAVKAKRFFLADADRYFIDSGPNVVSSAEMMAEILHGFDFGHEGKGFIRWHGDAPSRTTDVREDLYKVVVTDDCSRESLKSELSCDTVGNGGLDLKQSNHDDKHEISEEWINSQNTARDHPKYVTNIYETKITVSAERGQPDWFQGQSKHDIWNEETGVEHKDFSDDSSCYKVPEVVEIEPRRSLTRVESSSITPVPSRDVGPDGKNMFWDEPGVDWPRPTKEKLLYNPAASNLARSSVESSYSSLNSFHVVNPLKCSTEDKEDKKPVQVVRHPEEYKLASHTLHSAHIKQSSLDGNRISTLVKDTVTENRDQQQDLLSKIWASTQAAAKAKTYCTAGNSSPVSKSRVLHKSKSAPGPIEVSAGKNLDSGASSMHENGTFYKWKSLPRQIGPPAGSSNLSKLSSEDRRLSRISPRNSHSASAERDGFSGHHLPTINGSETSQNKNSFTSNSKSATRVAMSSKARVLRSLVLTSLTDILPVDCLLLSGGLASGILAEAAPLVHSGGFKVGLTVLAGPAATDRVFAEAVVKRCSMAHVVVGGGEKGNAAALLAQELDFVVETLKTFDPVELRNSVPVAAALREAKRRGFNNIVTGDGTDELFAGHSSMSITSANKSENPQQRIRKAIRSSAVLLGEALGIKVLQPFLHPKIVEYSVAHSKADLVGSRNGKKTVERLSLRKAFPEVPAAWRGKDPIEVGSGTSLLSEYFSKSIPVAFLRSKVDRIYRKERVRIRDAEHLVYYRAFKRVFKNKIPTGMIRWGSDPCPGCGYQLQTDMRQYCLVCGQYSVSTDVHPEQGKTDSDEVVQSRLSPSASIKNNQKRCSRSLRVKFEAVAGIDQPGSRKDDAKKVEASKQTAARWPRNCEASNKGTIAEGKHREQGLVVDKKHSKAKSPSCKLPSDPHGTKVLLKSNSKSGKRTKPRYLLGLGAGSAALFLLLQLLKH